MIPDVPIHVALSLPLELCTLSVLRARIDQAIRLGIPLLTIGLPYRHEAKFMDILERIFIGLADDPILETEQVKVSVLGTWYDLPPRVRDALKGIIEKTRDYDRCFVNLCVNYDGHAEIAGAASLLARQAMIGRIDPGAITPALVKENLYTSALTPPELIISWSACLGGFLLWDSRYAYCYVHEKPELSDSDFQIILEWLKKQKETKKQEFS